MTRVLVVRHDAIGDTLLSLPAIHALHAALPDAHLTVVTSKAAAAVVADDAAVAEVLAVADPAAATVPPADMAFAFTEKLWAYQWLKRSGATTRVGFWPGLSKPFKSLQVWPLLTHRAASEDSQTRDQGIHEVERYGALLSAAGLPSTLGPIRMAIPLAATEWAAAFAASMRGRVGVHLSEKWLRGGWPQQFLHRLVERLDAVVLYGPAEAGWAQEVPSSVRFFDPDLKRYGAVLSHLAILVTMDTSAAHLAASVGVPLVDVFPPAHFGHNTTRWRPWMVAHEIVQKPDWRADAEEPFLEAVTAAVERLRAAPGART